MRVDRNAHVLAAIADFERRSEGPIPAGLRWSRGARLRSAETLAQRLAKAGGLLSECWPTARPSPCRGWFLSRPHRRPPYVSPGLAALASALPLPEALNAPEQPFPHQRQAIVAEIHVVAIDEDGGRDGPGAPYQLLGIGLELLLDRRRGDAGRKTLGIDANLGANLVQHHILRDVSVIAPIRLESRACEGYQLPLGFEQQATAHGLDAVDRENRRRKDDLDAGGARPILQIFAHIGLLRRDRLLARGIDAGIDGVEDAADQERPPGDGRSGCRGKRLDPGKGEIGPRA